MPRKVITGQNDLASKRPDLAKQWIREKNLPATPETTAGGSNFLAWWRCDNGHEWESAVTSRVYMKAGCPFCSGRRPIPGETDLVSTDPEIAAQWHPTRNGALEPSDVSIGSEKRIWWRCAKGHEWDAVVYLRQKSGCPFCSGRYPIAGENDLLTLRPDIAAEWHPTRNGKKQPIEFTVGANTPVWWQCSKGHEWRTQIAKRTSAGRNCPYCANQKALAGYNDLASHFPEIASEWHPTKNGDRTPQDVLPGTQKKYWWRCSEGHDFENSVSARTGRNVGCPLCSSGGGFRATSPAFIYLLESHELGARKIGIANEGSVRLGKYDSHWQLIHIVQHNQGALIRDVENRLLSWIRNELGLGQQLEKKEMGNAGGWTETFGLQMVSNQEIIDRLTRLIEELDASNPDSADS